MSHVSVQLHTADSTEHCAGGPAAHAHAPAANHCSHPHATSYKAPTAEVACAAAEDNCRILPVDCGFHSPLCGPQAHGVLLLGSASMIPITDQRVGLGGCMGIAVNNMNGGVERRHIAVSYTHLTLPTICSV